MFSDAAEIKDELSSRLRVREVAFKWLFGEIKFTRDEFLSLYSLQDELAEFVNKAFVERAVMYEDVQKEDPAKCIDSLNKVADIAEETGKGLRGKVSPEQRSVARILEHIRSLARQHAKLLFRRNAETEEGNRGEFDSEFKVRWSDWVLEPVIDFRLAVYPHFFFLISLLGDHPSRSRAEDVWYSGRAVLPERSKDRALPQIALNE